jgi:hypothetical protein
MKQIDKERWKELFAIAFGAVADSDGSAEDIANDAVGLADAALAAEKKRLSAEETP